MKAVCRGFSLIELLVTIGIILLLSAMLFPHFAEAKKKARQTVKVSQLRQLSAALLHYSANNDGGLPLFPYGTGTEWHNIILPGPINQTALNLANPDKADTKTNDVFSHHIGYSLNQCLMRSEASESLNSDLNPYLIFQATELKNRTGFRIHKTWSLGCHDRQYAKEHDLMPSDGRFLADIDNGGSIASRTDGSIKWDSYKLFDNKPCTCAYAGESPETPFQTFPLRS
jgi:prepilin-type N-terminal cleavage/methylation domain-containing protein